MSFLNLRSLILARARKSSRQFTIRERLPRRRATPMEEHRRDRANKDVEVMTMAKYEAYFQQHRERHLQELNDFLRIPSVSALPEHADDVKRAARWAADNLRAAGVPYVEIIETEGHPSVYAQWIVDESLPTYLIYG